MGNADKALILSEESVALDRKTGNLHNLPRSLGTLGNSYRMLGEWEKAEKCYKEALSISQKQNIATSIAGSYLSLGSLNLAKENFREAREFFEKSSELYKKSGVRFGEAGLLTPAIWASIELGELEKAENRISVMQMIAQKLDNKQLFSFATVSRAMLLRAQKNWNESIEYFEKSFHEFEALNAKRWHAEFYARRFLCEYARVYLERGQEGDRDKARRLLNQALEIFQKINAKKEIEKTKAILLNIEKGLPAAWEQKRVDLVVTGHTVLDKLLYGGLHPGFSVVLTSPSCSERDSLVRSFVETGAKKGEPTFYLTANSDLAGLAQEYPSNLYLFICNPQAESIAKKFSNVFTLNGVENLTNINIALTKAIRKLDPASKIPRRICIDLVSDILLQHGLIMTRKWLTELITQLKTAGFTILAAIDSQMHPLEQLYAVLGLFDGEVNIREVETEEGLVRILRIKKMGNQKYSKDEVRLTVE
jgi:tetratricopeptide (TPR) repeat protein